MPTALRLFCLGLVLAIPAAALARPAFVPSTVNLRAAPGTSDDVVTKIPGGSVVEADNCADGWCAVTWQGKHGFAVQAAIDLGGRVRWRPAPAAEDAYALDEGPSYQAPPAPYPYYRPYWRRSHWRMHWRYYHW